ncbi:phage virion morphogenesis protein [Sodalis sp. (in: enterobacteria)]|uniref:phage virion morphogenesis protein n=1 Tax=Sodalis sp. (in: enterobacteria) TaxID=1898979 RepID=UPI003F689790
MVYIDGTLKVGNELNGKREEVNTNLIRTGKILRQSGRLAAFIDSDADNDQAVVGTNVVYARIYHQGGHTTRPHITSPRYKKALLFNGRVAKRANCLGSTMPSLPFLSLTD